MVVNRGASSGGSGGRIWAGLVAFAFLIASLAMTPATAAAEDRLSQVRRIGIIAALGDRVEIWAHAWAEKDSHLGYRPIDGWGLDDFARRTAIAAIGSRFQVTPIVCDTANLIAPDSNPPSEDLPRLKSVVSALPGQNVDAYLIIRKRTWHLSPPYVMDGLTATRNAILGSRTVFVTIQVDLVDAKTGATLSSRFLPGRTGLSREDWADTPDQISEVQFEHLHDRINEVVTRSVTSALRSMGLSGT